MQGIQASKISLGEAARRSSGSNEQERCFTVVVPRALSTPCNFAVQRTGTHDAFEVYDLAPPAKSGEAVPPQSLGEAIGLSLRQSNFNWRRLALRSPGKRLKVSLWRASNRRRESTRPARTGRSANISN